MFLTVSLFRRSIVRLSYYPATNNLLRQEEAWIMLASPLQFLLCHGVSHATYALVSAVLV